MVDPKDLERKTNLVDEIQIHQRLRKQYKDEHDDALVDSKAKNAPKTEEEIEQRAQLMLQTRQNKMYQEKQLKKKQAELAELNRRIAQEEKEEEEEPLGRAVVRRRRLVVAASHFLCVW